MNVSSLLKRLDKLETAMGQSRMFVFEMPDGEPDKARQITPGICRKNDVRIFIRRFSDYEPYIPSTA